MEQAIGLSIRCIGSLVGRDHRIVLVPNGQKLVLGHDVFPRLLHVILMDSRFDDGVDRTGFLAKTAINALEQVDVVARRAPRAVVAGIGFDRYRQRRTHGLAKLARNAALFTVRIAAQGVQAAEAMRLRRLFLRVLERHALAEKAAQGDVQTAEQFPQRQGLDDADDSTH